MPTAAVIKSDPEISILLTVAEAKMLVKYLDYSGKDPAQFRRENRDIYALADALDEALSRA